MNRALQNKDKEVEALKNEVPKHLQEFCAYRFICYLRRFQTCFGAWRSQCRLQVTRLQTEQSQKVAVDIQVTEQDMKLLQQRVRQLETALSESQMNANITSNHQSPTAGS